MANVTRGPYPGSTFQNCLVSLIDKRLLSLMFWAPITDSEMPIPAYLKLPRFPGQDCLVLPQALVGALQDIVKVMHRGKELDDVTARIAHNCQVSI